MKTANDLGREPLNQLPEKWCIERTKQTAEVINRVIDDVFNNGVKTHIMTHGYMHSKPVSFGHQKWHSFPGDKTKKEWGYTEITFSEFLRLFVVPNQDKLKMAIGHVPAIEPASKEERGLRYNTGKPQWNLVDFDSLKPMVRVLEYGANKYAPHNWKKGMPHAEIADCLLRHLFAWLHGEDTDQESGQSHIGHVLCNAMFLSYNAKHHPDLDNRYKITKK